MSALADRRRDAHNLVRLRDVRMQAAARALAEARAETLAAERARAAADAAANEAATAHHAAREGLAADPGEAERLLAMLDRRQFERSVAVEALTSARDAEHERQAEEQARRHAMILARARHEVLVERAGELGRMMVRAEEERAALDAEDIRRFR